MTNAKRYDWPEYVPWLNELDVYCLGYGGSGRAGVAETFYRLAGSVFGSFSDEESVVMRKLNWASPYTSPAKLAALWNRTIDQLGVYEPADKAVPCDLDKEWPGL